MKNNNLKLKIGLQIKIVSNKTHKNKNKIILRRIKKNNYSNVHIKYK